MYLSLDRHLVGCDEVVRSSSFSTDVTVVAVVVAAFFAAIIIVTWSGGRCGRSRSGRGRRSPWSTWSVVDEARTWSKRMAMKSAVELLSN